MDGDRQPLDINFTKKTRLNVAGAKTIMPVTLQGQQIISKNLIKPTAKKPGKGKGKRKPKGKKPKKPVKGTK
jgi:hypothetical protein